MNTLLFLGANIVSRKADDRELDVSAYVCLVVVDVK